MTWRVLLPNAPFWSIRGRLVAGFAVLVALHAVAGYLGRRSMTDSSRVIGTTLAAVQEDARLSTRLTLDVTRALDEASRYLRDREARPHARRGLIARPRRRRARPRARAS